RGRILRGVRTGTCATSRTLNGRTCDPVSGKRVLWRGQRSPRNGRSAPPYGDHLLTYTLESARVEYPLRGPSALPKSASSTQDRLEDRREAAREGHGGRSDRDQGSLY